MLGSVPDDDVVVIADLEAGIGTLTRLDEATVDVTIVVVEPTPRSIDVARRALVVAGERSQGRVLVVANKVGSPADVDRIREALGGEPAVVVPDDGAVVRADRVGASIVDEPGGQGAVAALEELARLLG